jgi:oligopeptide/dipeptide ABC transporter ATP-binding protein
MFSHAEVRARTAAVVRPLVDAVPPSVAGGDGAAPVLTMRGVAKTFVVGSRLRRGSRLQALRGVSLTVDRGESVALVGESGSGKSTLLRVAAGLESHDLGEIHLRSQTRPQMVFQDSGASLTPWMTVEELIGERLRDVPRRQRSARVADALALVGLPREVAKAKAGQLSGGQRQRVCLARATVVPLTAAPVHPYTKALMSAVPDVGREPIILSGEPASPLRPPSGCAFHPRCPQATEYCSQEELDVRLTAYRGNERHQVACINPDPPVLSGSVA